MSHLMDGDDGNFKAAITAYTGVAAEDITLDDVNKTVCDSMKLGIHHELTIDLLDYGKTEVEENLFF